MVVTCWCLRVCIPAVRRTLGRWTAREFASAPDWLIAQISGSSNSCKKLCAPATEWAHLVIHGADKGQRNYAVTRLCGYLLRHINSLVALELLQLWNAAHCRPPLPADDVHRIVKSISGREIKRRLGHGGC